MPAEREFSAFADCPRSLPRGHRAVTVSVERNALHKAGQQAAADKAQKQVVRYYDKMYQRGYFRDSHNSSNLLWLFDLSWWRDVSGVLVGKDGKMSPENADRPTDHNLGGHRNVKRRMG